MESFNEVSIDFLCEQDGDVEREFKQKINLLFLNSHQHIRAYLVRVKYDNVDNFNVALCLQMEEGEDPNLLKKVFDIFKPMFIKGESLDVIFLNLQQESAVRKVSCPFFTSLMYQYPKPDFYLICEEVYGLDKSFACFKRKKLNGVNPEGYMLCDINPSISGQRYGLGDMDIPQVILASRHKEYSILSIKDWPTFAHITIPRNSFKENDYVAKDTLSLIDWGGLYENLKDIPLKK
jgi:hypothetical protein